MKEENNEKNQYEWVLPLAFCTYTEETKRTILSYLFYVLLKTLIKGLPIILARGNE